jgi:starvation-inducible outer membrane lipoprotein
MQDKSSADGSTVLFTLMLGLIVSGGISIASNAIGSKDDTIATQQKQIEALEQRLTQAEARFQGFVEGRR